MSTIAGSTNKEQISHDILEYVSRLAGHVDHKTIDPHSKLTIKTQAGDRRRVSFLEMPPHFWLTPHGLIKKGFTWKARRPVQSKELVQFPTLDLVEIRLQLIQFTRYCPEYFQHAV
jgi:hypothetical protein